MAQADQQSEFNAGMLANARGFALDPTQRAAINASAYRSVDLQLAMQRHLYEAKQAECLAHFGWVIMPNHIETMIARAWDACGEEFMAIAKRDLAQREAA